MPAWRRSESLVHLVFAGDDGTPIDPRTLNRFFTARCDQIAARHMTVHDAGRTCATLFADLSTEVDIGHLCEDGERQSMAHEAPMVSRQSARQRFTDKTPA